MSLAYASTGERFRRSMADRPLEVVILPPPGRSPRGRSSRIRYALMFTVSVGIWAGAHLAVAAKSIPLSLPEFTVPVLVSASGETVRPAQRWEWRTASPEREGMSAGKLEAMKNELAAHRTTGLLVIRNDRIVLEWYALGYSVSRRHYTASLAKAIVGGVAAAVLLSDGRIRLGERAAKWIPQWRNDPRKSRITLRQLGSHTSGLADAVRMVTSDAGTPGNCGVGWWNNQDGEYARVPRDAFWGSGAGHQVLFVVPSLDLIAVRNGEALEQVSGNPFQYHEPLRRLFFEPLIGAITDRAGSRSQTAPVPHSPIIRRVEWASPATILRRSQGSDNWPMTWGDDGALYTAYGDGYGFKPHVPRKLSLGFAKVLGTPSRISGQNIRSETGEQLGDGPRGKKASGLLMVGGVLYMWARNAGNAQLAWSVDHAASWRWSHWKFTTSFGCPSFLNYGRNNAGARDHFVYVYSPDRDNAYECANCLVLARVPRNQIRQRGAYEFLQNLRRDGRPRWTRELARRGAVLTYPGGCYRCSVTYDRPLKRYLLVMPVVSGVSRDGRGRVDTRFQGGLAIYDAPEPWGPWTTVFFTEKWDVGPGDAASFPAKWIGADGKTLYLVFSEGDSFAVRRATFHLAIDRQ